MKVLSKLLLDVKDVKAKYDIEREKNRFNFITALHKEHDEVNLHSRFITYLLAPHSNHGFNEKFAEIFIREVLKIDEGNFDLSNYEVFPNEFNKSEYKNIDILIINKSKKQAIIIENKIYADDSNRKKVTKKKGYSGQLERYYNTIKKGIDENSNKIYDFQCNEVLVYYLTMFRHKQPTDDSIGELDKNQVNVIYYDDEISEWLEKCLNVIPKEESIKKEFINQYLYIINKMTHNDIFKKERMELKNKVAQNWKCVKYLIDNFQHVKWHTVDLFWVKLKEELKNKGFKNREFYQEGYKGFADAITAVTHRNKDINHGILFDISEGKKAYISGVGLLSWGILDPKQWKDFNDEKIQNISFSGFTTDNTYKLINEENMKKAIQLIVKEISEEVDNDFANMKSD